MGRLLPLFPLELVLLPGESLPLHIFEPRYKEMIGECLELKQPFGLVRASEKAGKQGMARLGCSADIINVSKTYDDGRMDILTRGQRRFEVLDVDQTRDFVQAEVLYFDDEPGDAPILDDCKRALKLHKELLALGGLDQVMDESHPQLSFHLAGTVPLDLDFKQMLLSVRSEKERLDALIHYYERLLPRLRRALKARAMSGGNGHVM